MNGLRSVRMRGIKCAALCCAVAALLLMLPSGGPALAASAASPPDYVIKAATFARANFGRGDIEWAACVGSTARAVAPALGLTPAQARSWLPATPPAYLVYLVVMKGEFDSRSQTGSYLRFVVYQRGGATNSTLFAVSASPPPTAALGTFEKVTLPSHFWEQARRVAGYALVLGLPLLLLVFAGFVAWSRSRWWVAAVSAPLGLAVAGVSIWLMARSSFFPSEKLAGVAVVGALCVAGTALATRTGFVMRRGGAVERTLSVRQASAILLGLAVVAYFLALPFLGSTGE
jgi:hypothetical protein